MCSCESMDGSVGRGGNRTYARGLGRRGGAPARAGAELDLEREPLREVPVVGEGDDAPGRVGREPADEQQRVAGGHPEQVGVLRAGQAGGHHLANRGDPMAVPGERLPDAGPGRGVAADRSGQVSRNPFADHVEALAVDGPQRPRVQDLGALLDPEGPGQRTRSGAVPELDDATVDGLAGLGHRGGRVPERADGEPLVEGRPGDEPPGAVPRVDQALVTEHLERPSHGRTGHLVPVAELRLGVERADVAELAERDALAEVVGDGGEPRTCH